MVKNLGNIYFAISKTCNLACKYCYVPKENKNQKASDEIALRGFEKFVDKLVDENVVVRDICFIGAEPTMISPHVYVHMIAYYRKHFERLDTLPHFTIETNGTRLEEFIALLDPSEMRIGVSLDGWESHNDAQRGEGVFAKATANIKKAKEKGFVVSVLTVLSKPLIRENHKLLTFINDMASIGVHVTLKPIHTEEERLSVFNKDGYNFGKWIAKQGMQAHTQIRPDVCTSKGNNCMFFEFDYEGKVYSCNKAYVAGGEFADWFEESFDAIVAKRVPLYHKHKIANECFSCVYVTRCFSGCPMDRVDGKAVDCFIKRGMWDNENFSRLYKITITRKWRENKL